MKHQIRRALAGHGTPILGDVLYGGERGDTSHFVALHSATIQAAHPARGYPPLRVSAPLPDGWIAAALPALLIERARLELAREPGGGYALWGESPELADW